jgi:glucan phosphoethanolaminetransferase (alkaline phosphatase superfamily)
MLDLLRRPSAFAPLLISLGFLATLLTKFFQGTLVRQPDEGTAAHLFQILMPLQILIVAFFAACWLPRRTKPALAILSLQVAAAVAVVAIVYFEHL